MTTQFKRSAGGLIISNNKVLILFSKKRNQYLFPKGTIENNETPRQTALREVLEESGYHTKILKSLGSIHYSFEENGNKIRKTVYHYLLKLVDDQEIPKPNLQQNEDFRNLWLNYREAYDKLSHLQNKEILANVLGYLSPYKKINVSREINLVSLYPKDASKLFQLTDRNREYLGRWLPWVDSVSKTADSREFILKSIIDRSMGEIYPFGISYKNRLVGHISIMNLDKKNESPDIGYWIDQDYSSRGIMSQSVKVLTEFAHDTLKINTITIHAEPDNIGSNMVAKKNGYTLIGQTTKDNRQLNRWQKTN